MSYVPPNPPSATPSSDLPVTAPPPATSNRKLWIILGSVVGGGCLVLLCSAIVVVGVLSLLGRRVERTFEQIGSGLEQDTYMMPTPLPYGAQSEGRIDPTLSQSIGVVVTSREFESGTSTIKPQAGYEFLIITYKTTGGTQADLVRVRSSMMASTRIMDDAGRTFACCATKFMQARQLDKFSFDPAGSVFKFAYEIPADAQTLFWVEDNQPGVKPSMIKLR